MVSFSDDDEPIVAPKDRPSARVSGTEAEVVGKVEVTVFKKEEAPLEETDFKMMVKLTGAEIVKNRKGVDLVLVLDVSSSMSSKLDKMKTAVKFLIKKLSPIDRLSIVTFSDEAKRLCQLQCVTETSQPKLENLVGTMETENATNMYDGLQKGLQVLNDRRFTEDRVVAIMLMSDGEQNKGDAREIQVDKVPVYTFGFGENHGPEVLNEIANKSMGGTFSDVQKAEDLSKAFGQCLAGLLTVVVQDLKLTVKPLERSEIKKVSAGSYRQSRLPEDGVGAAKIEFGDLYAKERRKVMVDLLLPAFKDDGRADIIEIRIEYNSIRFKPLIYGVKRVKTPVERVNEEVMTEDNRLQTAKMVSEARESAKNDLEKARKMIDEAKTKLQSAPDNEMTKMLTRELDQLEKLMSSPDVYKKKGHPFALSSETSHNRQRFAARGDDMDNLRLFATPRMDKYLEQAKSFDEDPSKPPPTEEEDRKQELLANPRCPFVRALSYYIQTAIQALKSLDGRTWKCCLRMKACFVKAKKILVNQLKKTRIKIMKSSHFYDSM